MLTKNLLKEKKKLFPLNWESTKTNCTKSWAYCISCFICNFFAIFRSFFPYLFSFSFQYLSILLSPCFSVYFCCISILFHFSVTVFLILNVWYILSPKSLPWIYHVAGTIYYAVGRNETDEYFIRSSIYVSWGWGLNKAADRGEAGLLYVHSMDQRETIQGQWIDAARIILYMHLCWWNL